MCKDESDGIVILDYPSRLIGDYVYTEADRKNYDQLMERFREDVVKNDIRVLSYWEV